MADRQQRKLTWAMKHDRYLSSAASFPTAISRRLKPVRAVGLIPTLISALVVSSPATTSCCTQVASAETARAGCSSTTWSRYDTKPSRARHNTSFSRTILAFQSTAVLRPPSPSILRDANDSLSPVRGRRLQYYRSPRWFKQKMWFSAWNFFPVVPISSYVGEDQPGRRVNNGSRRALHLGTNADDIGRCEEGGGVAEEKGEDEGQPGANGFPKDGAVKDDEGGEGTRFAGIPSKGMESRRSWRASDASSTAGRNNATRPKLKHTSDTGGVAAGTDRKTSTAVDSGIRAIATEPSDADVSAKVLSFDFAPPMTVHKFKTMQDRRVPVMIKYTGGGGFKRYFDEIASVLKRHFPDVRIDREIVEGSTREEEVFEIRIDGKLVCTKRRGKAGVYLHMQTIEQAIRKARQRHRPGAVVYGDRETYQNVKTLLEDRAADDHKALQASVQDGPEEDLLRGDQLLHR